MANKNEYDALPTWRGPAFDLTGVQFVRYTPERLITLNTLSGEAKRATWETIKKNNPALADLLLDTHLQAIAQAFNAEIKVRRADVDGGTTTK